MHDCLQISANNFGVNVGFIAEWALGAFQNAFKPSVNSSFNLQRDPSLMPFEPGDVEARAEPL